MQLDRSFGTESWIITREMAQMRRGHLTNHILPQFKDREVGTITSADIDDWLLGLNVANATKNHIMDTFRVVLDEAKRAGLVKRMLQGKSSNLLETKGTETYLLPMRSRTSSLPKLRRQYPSGAHPCGRLSSICL
jgi:hypothetical protein